MPAHAPRASTSRTNTMRSTIRLPRFPMFIAQPSITFVFVASFFISIAVIALHSWQIQQATNFDSSIWGLEIKDERRSQDSGQRVTKYRNLRAPWIDMTPHMLAVSAGYLNIIFILFTFGVIRHFTPNPLVCLECNKLHQHKTSYNPWTKGMILILWLATCFVAAGAYIQTLFIHLEGARITGGIWLERALSTTEWSNGHVYRDGKVWNLERWTCSLVEDIWTSSASLTGEDSNRAWNTCMVGIAGRYALSLLCMSLIPLPFMVLVTLSRLPAWRQRLLIRTR